MKFSESVTEYDIVGIGVSTLDILTIVTEFAAEDSVQQAIDAKFQGGGPVATALVAAAKLGAKVAMIDSLGDDFVGQSILEEFNSYGVITKYLQITSGKTSSIASVWIREQDGQRAIAYRPGNAPELRENCLALEIIKKAQVIHLNGRHLQCCFAACRLAKEHGVKISFDGGGGRYRSELDPLIPLIDIGIVARDFAEKYAQTTNIDNAAQCLLDQGCELVVITDGDRGSYIFSETENFHQPAFEPNKVVDTTGCGDVYHGVFLFSLISGLSLRESARRATAVAAINAQRIGGRGMLSTMSEISDFMASSTLKSKKNILST